MPFLLVPFAVMLLMAIVVMFCLTAAGIIALTGAPLDFGYRAAVWERRRLLKALRGNPSSPELLLALANAAAREQMLREATQ